MMKPIIFIDDDIDELALLQEMAAKMYYPHEVIVFSKADKALAYLCSLESEPLFILSDINMPCLNGYELRDKMLRLNLVASRAPFIFHSTVQPDAAIVKNCALNVKAAYRKANTFEGIQETLKQIRRMLQPG